MSAATGGWTGPAWENIETAEVELLNNLAVHGGLVGTVPGMLRHCAGLISYGQARRAAAFALAEKWRKEAPVIDAHGGEAAEATAATLRACADEMEIEVASFRQKIEAGPSWQQCLCPERKAAAGQKENVRRAESIRLIAHALEALDGNRQFEFMNKGTELLKVTVKIGSEAEYLAKAERMLDSEIVRMAEERIMERIRGERSWNEAQS